MIGGLVVATVLTLGFLPALHALVFGVGRKTPKIEREAVGEFAAISR
jgi:hypothetical protein